MTSVVCINQFASGAVEFVSIKQEPETDGDAADQPEPLNLSKPKFPKLDNSQFTVPNEKSAEGLESETGECKEELQDIKQTLKDLIQSRRLAEGKNVLTPVDLVTPPVKIEMSQEEVIRAEERKEQNRKAAHRCRMRRKQQMQILKEEEAKLKRRRRELESQIGQLNQEKQKLLMTIRSDKQSFNAKSKGDNSLDTEITLDLSDTDASLTDSQEMPLNLHKDADVSDKSAITTSVPCLDILMQNFSDSESSKASSAKGCKCCCPCRCHHSNTSTDSDGSASDMGSDIDIKETNDHDQLRPINKPEPNLSEHKIEPKKCTTRKHFSRSISWESAKEFQKSCENSKEKNVISDESSSNIIHKPFGQSLQTFHIKTIEGTIKKNRKDSNTAEVCLGDFTTRPLKIVPWERQGKIGGEVISCNNDKITEQKDNKAQSHPADITSSSDNNKYYTDNNYSSVNSKSVNNYQNAFDVIRMDEISLKCLNSIYNQKKPFFYKDTMN